MTEFTPFLSLIGGVMIGIAATMFLALNGRMVGISGIVGGLYNSVRGDRSWRLTFLIGLLTAPLVYMVFEGGPPDVVIPGPLPFVILGGLLVGFGTRMGSGCTSGHGVCGIARVSNRSITATATFMATGILTVYIIQHVVGG
jgi:hypothetical protein